MKIDIYSLKSMDTGGAAGAEAPLPLVAPWSPSSIFEERRRKRRRKGKEEEERRKRASPPSR
jgi:hypothetical protein